MVIPLNWFFLKILWLEMTLLLFFLFFFLRMAGISEKAQFHIITPQRVIRIMHCSPTLRHIPAPAVCTRTLAEGFHREDLWRSAQPRHTCAALIILLLVLPTSKDGRLSQACRHGVYLAATALELGKLKKITLIVLVFICFRMV